MADRQEAPRVWPMLLAAAIALAGWAVVGWWWHDGSDPEPTLPVYFFVLQDAPVLLFLALGLLAAIPIGGSRSVGDPAPPSDPTIALACLAAVVAARLGHDIVFHDYSASRDEVMVETGAAYLAEGRLGWPIPLEWRAHARAIMPEFMSPYGADIRWTSVYLPVHAAIRALFLRAGDAAFAAPVTLGIGLWALWDCARRLLPGRRDAQAVAMVLALTSTQLVATAMTPYAMTSHFALDMVWLALVLRGTLPAHVAAAAVLVIATGLHQWHFPILFAGPFVLWLAWRRDWRGAAIQAVGLGAGILLWAKLWPLWLAHRLGPAAAGSAGPAPGVGAKLASLFGRLDRWQPLLNVGRLIAWNNPLLLPLGMVALWPRRRAGWLRDPPIALPLAAVLAIGVATALYQGYGWGFRYMHGALGALCLLAGIGWTRLSPDGRRPLTLLWCGSVLALVAGAFLLVTTERYVAGYARTMAAIRRAPVDAVLVDLRGGYFMGDLVRFDDGRPGRPMVLSLAMMTPDELARLCRTHSVAVIDHGQFQALGIHPVDPVVREGRYLDGLRRALDRLRCGRPVITPASR